MEFLFKLLSPWVLMCSHLSSNHSDTTVWLQRRCTAHNQHSALKKRYLLNLHWNTEHSNILLDKQEKTTVKYNGASLVLLTHADDPLILILISKDYTSSISAGSGRRVLLVKITNVSASRTCRLQIISVNSWRNMTAAKNSMCRMLKWSQWPTISERRSSLRTFVLLWSNRIM